MVWNCRLRRVNGSAGGGKAILGGRTEAGGIGAPEGWKQGDNKVRSVLWKDPHGRMW